MTAKIFIDGSEGTTGLAIRQHLINHPDIRVIEIESSHRKDKHRRSECFRAADIAVLCLPDAAAREATKIAGDSRILDASTAHRVNNQWVYGLPELSFDQRQKIARGQYVSNPGCYPTGFLLLVRPLIEQGILKKDQLIKVNAVSGYSGGGKTLITEYESQRVDRLDTRPYGLTLAHKHVPEMQKYSLLERAPLFVPSVGPFRQGMLIQVPFSIDELQATASGEKIVQIYQNKYQNEKFIDVYPFNDDSKLDGNFLNAIQLNGTNHVELFVFGSSTQLVLIARLDNLGKGASIGAIQNLNLMLGFDESTGIPDRAPV